MPQPFQVIYSGAVLDQWRATLEELWNTDKSFAKIVVDALKQIDNQLNQSPGEFGEALYRLDKVDLEVRVGIVRPVGVKFGVHLDSPLVFVTSMYLLSPPN